MIAVPDQSLSAAMFASEAPSSAGCNMVPGKSHSSPTYIFPENLSNQDATDDVQAGSTQPLLDFHLGGHADKQDSSLMNNAFKYDLLQANTLSDVPVAPAATEYPIMENIYANPTVPSFDSCSYNYTPPNLQDSCLSQTESRIQPFTPVSMNMVDLRGCKDHWPRTADTRQPGSATSAYQDPPMATMGAAPPSTVAVPYSNQGFNPMRVTPANIHSFSNPSFTTPVPAPFSNGFRYPYPSYDTQRKTSTHAAASNAPILRVNVEYPLNQPTNSGFQVPQPMSYLSNGYAQGISPISQSQANYDWEFPVQTPTSGFQAVPVVSDSQGYYMKSSNAKEFQDVSQQAFYDQINNIVTGDSSSISAAQSVPSPVSRGRENLRPTCKRRRESPSPDVPSSPLAGPSIEPVESGSKQDQETPHICRWEGCNQLLPRHTTKMSYSYHLDKCHKFRGNLDQAIIDCKWTEPGSEPGTVIKCTAKLQKQSVIKHTAGRHLKLMMADCPLCGSSQARSDNMFRHFKSCEEFYALDEEEKKALWEEYTVQPFEEYIKSEGIRENKTTRKKRKVSKPMKKRKPLSKGLVLTGLY